MSLKRYFRNKLNSIKAKIENDRKLSNQMHKEMVECHQEVVTLQKEIGEIIVDHRRGVQAMMDDLKRAVYINNRVKLESRGDKAVEELDKF